MLACGKAAFRTLHCLQGLEKGLPIVNLMENWGERRAQAWQPVLASLAAAWTLCMWLSLSLHEPPSTPVAPLRSLHLCPLFRAFSCRLFANPVRHVHQFGPAGPQLDVSDAGQAHAVGGSAARPCTQREPVGREPAANPTGVKPHLPLLCSAIYCPPSLPPNMAPGRPLQRLCSAAEGKAGALPRQPVGQAC